MRTIKPNLMEYQKKPLIDAYYDVTYKTKSLIGFVEAEEIHLRESEVELEDDLLGIFDSPINLELLEWMRSIDIVKKSTDDPMNKHAPMLRYWNFYLTREQGIYFRVRYNLMGVIGEVGGIMGLLGSIAYYLLKPLYYKKNEMEVYHEFKRMN